MCNYAVYAVEQQKKIKWSHLSLMNLWGIFSIYWVGFWKLQIPLHIHPRSMSVHSQKYTNKSFTLTTFSPAHLKHSIKDSSTMFSSPDWLTDWLLKYAYRPRTVLVCTSLLLYMVPHSCSSLLQYICKVGGKGLFIYCFPKSKTQKMASLFSLIIISAFMQKADLNGILEDIRP